MAHSPPPPPQYAGQPPETNGTAVAACIVGLCSLVLACVWYVSLPGAIVAIALGVVARDSIQRGRTRGAGLATTGIVAGTIVLLLYCLGLLLMFAGCAALGGLAVFAESTNAISN